MYVSIVIDIGIVIAVAYITVMVISKLGATD